MKRQADAKQREMQYEIGDWVLLKLRPYRQTLAKGAKVLTGKLAQRYYRPFQVIEHVGPVAYKLQLPEGVKIHHVFHCSKMKPFKGSPDSMAGIELPTDCLNDQPLVYPLAILDYRRASQKDPWEVLVEWNGLSPDDTSWES